MTALTSEWVKLVEEREKEMAGGGGAGRKVAVAAVQFACTDTESDNVATAERYV